MKCLKAYLSLFLTLEIIYISSSAALSSTNIHIPLKENYLLQKLFSRWMRRAVRQQPPLLFPLFSDLPSPFQTLGAYLQTHTTSSVFLHLSFCLLYTVKEEDNLIEIHRSPYPLHYGLNKSVQKPQVRVLSRLCPEISTKFYVHEFGFWAGRFRRTLFSYACSAELSYRPARLHRIAGLKHPPILFIQ